MDQRRRAGAGPAGAVLGAQGSFDAGERERSWETLPPAGSWRRSGVDAATLLASSGCSRTRRPPGGSVNGATLHRVHPEKPVEIRLLGSSPKQRQKCVRDGSEQQAITPLGIMDVRGRKPHTETQILRSASTAQGLALVRGKLDRIRRASRHDVAPTNGKRARLAGRLLPRQLPVNNDDFSLDRHNFSLRAYLKLKISISVTPNR